MLYSCEPDLAPLLLLDGRPASKLCTPGMQFTLSQAIAMRI